MSFLESLNGARRSLTVWFNSVVLAALPLLESIKEFSPGLQAYLTPENFKLVGISVILINIILRFKTKKPLSEK